MRPRPGVRLVCGNCGRIEYFESFDSAFMAGWDTIERFGYNACARCPGVSVYMPMHFAQQARDKPHERDEWLARAAAATLEFDPATRTRAALSNTQTEEQKSP